MKPWRKHEDAITEAHRMGVETICRNLGWNKRKINSEMNASGSPEAFIARIQRAIAALDAPRLLAADSSRLYTDDPRMALPGEPEAVSEAFQQRITADVRAREAEAMTELIQAAEELQAALRARLSASAEFRKIAGLSIHRIDREMEKLIQNTRKKAA